MNDAWFWLPPLVGLVLAFFCSMVGISGAFLLLPFQMSVMGLSGPATSATNLLFNLFATPGGIWRYWRDGRLIWPLALMITLGSLPGIVVGFYIRTRWLPDASRFKLFVGAVLLYLAYRLLAGLFRRDERLDRTPQGGIGPWQFTGGQLVFSFDGEQKKLSVAALLGLACFVGIIGGTYGIGGGALIAPFLIAVFGLPVHALAGAALTATFATSVFGVAVYALMPDPNGGSVAPDWMLGSLFGVGGFVGMVLGSACQKWMPQKILQGALGLLLALLSLSYLTRA